MHKYCSQEAIKEHLENKHFEMILYGGIRHGQLYNIVFHCCLDFTYKQNEISGASLSMKRLMDCRGVEYPHNTLLQNDRFFYNQVFYLEKPTYAMREFYPEGPYFDKTRFIGVAGREAFHVFDLEVMNFTYADHRIGYAQRA